MEQSTHLHYLPTGTPVFRCECGTIVSLQDELVSRAFSGSNGIAFLVRTVINTTTGKKLSKHLLTGKHVIASLSCRGCGAEIGWTYYATPKENQAYKMGKSVVEKGKIYKDNQWML